MNWKYLPLKWLLACLARLPFWVLYGISDILFVVTYYIVGYRKKVVKQNLAESFPDKTEAERKSIMRQFYRNFTDMIVETIKIGHISDKQIKRRMTFENIELIDRLFDQGRSIAAYFSHCGNWEWATSITLWSEHTNDCKFCQVYRPLRNKWFDAYMLGLRSRFGAHSLPKNTTLRELLRMRRDKILSITGFMSDQKPSHGDDGRILKFLNHPTAIITGTEILARKLDMAIVYFDMYKIKRGHYTIKLVPIANDTKAMPEMAITDKYAQLLEATICRNPSIWLWTHKRWKNKVEYPSNIQP